MALRDGSRGGSDVLWDRLSDLEGNGMRRHDSVSTEREAALCETRPLKYDVWRTGCEFQFIPTARIKFGALKRTID